jgi:hypothetical protein
MIPGAIRRPCAALLVALGAAAFAAQPAIPGGQAAPAADAGLEAFRAWLSRERPGYGCDEGPAPFRNHAVSDAYPGQRFYYVLTYARGIPPPFENGVSLVAAVDDSGRVCPLRPASIETYRRGLMRVRSSKDAKRAAAAVLALASCDPGGRRWKYEPDQIEARKSSKGWKCAYAHGPNYSSWVRFDARGTLVEMGGSAPPVP